MASSSSSSSVGALWLALVCAASCAFPVSGAALKVADAAGGQQQQQLAYPNLRRYYITDLDMDGRQLKAPAEKWSVLRMDELLESLNDELASPPPVLKLEPSLRIVKQVSARAEGLGSPLGLLEWNARSLSQPVAAEQVELLSNQAPINGELKQQQQQQPQSPEGAGAGGSPGSLGFQGSLKRVPIENSRWNNLRGMWGKRSV